MWRCFASVFMGFDALGVGLLSFCLKKEKRKMKKGQKGGGWKSSVETRAMEGRNLSPDVKIFMDNHPGLW